MAADTTGFLQDGHFLGRDRPAWWDAKGAHTFPEDEDLTVADAMKRTDLWFDVEKRKNFVEGPDGEMIETGYYSVVRPPIESDPETRIFRGTVSDNYTPIQNREIAEILDSITEQAGWPVETVGALAYGEKLFVVLDAGPQTVGPDGDKLANYYLAIDDRSGNGMLTVQYTPTRVVCQNTLKIALDSAEVDVKIGHTKKVKDEMSFYARVLKDLKASQQNATDAMDQMARHRVSSDQLQRVLENTYPEPAKNQKVKTALRIRQSQNGLGYSSEEKDLAMEALQRWERRRDRQQELQEVGEKAYKAFNERNRSSQMAGSMYALYNGIAESESWRESTNNQIRARSVLLGSRGDKIRDGFTQCMKEMAA